MVQRTTLIAIFIVYLHILIVCAANNMNCTSPAWSENISKKTDHTIPSHLLNCINAIKKKLKNPIINIAVKNVVSFLVEQISESMQNKFLSKQNRYAIKHNIFNRLNMSVFRKRLNKYTQCPKSNYTLLSIGMCAIQESSAPYINEWISHYLLLGISKIFIYDNSIPNSDEHSTFRFIVKPFVEAGYVEIIDWFGEIRQGIAYNNCLRLNKYNFDWIAIFDIDEYLVISPPKSVCLPIYMENYINYPGLYIARRSMVPIGTFRHNYNKLFLEQYLWQQNDKTWGKSIVNPKLIKSYYHYRHLANYANGRFSVNSDKNEVKHSFVPELYHFKEIELRHYVGIDWEFMLLTKICGQTLRRQHNILKNAALFVSWLDKECCTKIANITQEEVILRKVMFDK